MYLIELAILLYYVPVSLCLWVYICVVADNAHLHDRYVYVCVCLFIQSVCVCVCVCVCVWLCMHVICVCVVHACARNHVFVFQLAPEQGLAPIEEPSQVKKKCDEEADTTVSQICQVGLPWHSFDVGVVC